MRFTLKLPGRGYLKYEKKPMSQDAWEDLMYMLLLLSFLVFFGFLFWITK